MTAAEPVRAHALDAACRPRLVLVDDEDAVLRSLVMLFRAQYEVFATSEPRLAIEYVRRYPVHVIVADQRMPAMRGADLLRSVRQISPNTMRLLLTGYSEMDAIVASVNEGEVFRFLSKPWQTSDLRATVALATNIALDLFSITPPGVDAVVPSTNPPAEVLVIDHDSALSLAVGEIVGPLRPVHEVPSLEAALQVLAQRPIGVVIADLFAGSEPIATFLKMLKAQHPHIVTMVVTPHEDTDVFIGLINQGQVYRFLRKPVGRAELISNIASAVKHHSALRAAPKLLAQHTVDPVPVNGEATVVARILDYLARLRHRVLPFTTASSAK